jgi:hypothetical protein
VPAPKSIGGISTLSTVEAEVPEEAEGMLFYVGGAAPGGDHRTLLRHLDGPREEEKSHRISRPQSVPAGWPEMCQQE